MKSLFMAVAALVVSAAAAQASSLVCAMTTAGGDTVAYNLSPVGGDLFAEDVFVKNGAAIIRKSTELRPMWKATVSAPIVLLTYQADDKFNIAFNMDKKDSDGDYQAVLMKSGAAIGAGFCKLS